MIAALKSWSESETEQQFEAKDLAVNISKALKELFQESKRSIILAGEENLSIPEISYGYCQTPENWQWYQAVIRRLLERETSVSEDQLVEKWLANNGIANPA